MNAQFALKQLVRTYELREMSNDDFYFILVRGKLFLVKYITDFESDLDILEE